MGEWRLQESNYPATFDYHKDRERAPHLEQDHQSPRLHAAARLVREAKPESVVDLGCGDGGLLSLIKDIPSWGYDFQPSNQEGWTERGVTAFLGDVFNTRADVMWGQLAVATEVLEHLENPHDAVRWISRNATYIVASSPHNERPDGHDPDCHIWAWDHDGYRDMLAEHFEIIKHETIYWSQLILGRSKHV